MAGLISSVSSDVESSAAVAETVNLRFLLHFFAGPSEIDGLLIGLVNGCADDEDLRIVG
jgi:hypothetical protein